MDPNQSPLWKPKFHLAAAIVAMAFFALLCKYVDAETFKDIVLTVFAGFSIASVTENRLLKP